jgi:hypothetical protein
LADDADGLAQLEHQRRPVIGFIVRQRCCHYGIFNSRRGEITRNPAPTQFRPGGRITQQSQSDA